MRSRRTCWEVRGTLSQSRWTLRNAAHPIRTSSSRSMKKTRLAWSPKGRLGGTRPCLSPFTRRSPRRVLIEPIPNPHFRLRPPPPQPSLTHRSHPVAFLLPRTQSMEPNTSPLFVLHGKHNDPAKPITLSCQGCMPGSTDSDSAAATSRGQLGMAVILTLTARLWLSL